MAISELAILIALFLLFLFGLGNLVYELRRWLEYGQILAPGEEYPAQTVSAVDLWAAVLGAAVGLALAGQWAEWFLIGAMPGEAEGGCQPPLRGVRGAGAPRKACATEVP